MKLYWQNFEIGQKYHLVDDIDFSNVELNTNYIRRILDCHVEVDVENLSTFLRVKINLVSHVVLPCAYTLEDVDYTLKGNEEFDFVEDIDLADNENLFFEKDEINLDSYIYSVLIALIPPKVVKKGATLPKGGEGYKVMTEDEYVKMKKKEKDPRWAVLDDIDL